MFYCYRDRRRVQCSVYTRPAQQARELRAFTVRDSEQSRTGEGEPGPGQHPVRCRRPCRQDDGQAQGRNPAQLKGVRHIMNARCVPIPSQLTSFKYVSGVWNTYSTFLYNARLWIGDSCKWTWAASATITQLFNFWTKKLVALEITAFLGEKVEVPQPVPDA